MYIRPPLQGYGAQFRVARHLGMQKILHLFPSSLFPLCSQMFALMVLVSGFFGRGLRVKRDAGRKQTHGEKLTPIPNSCWTVGFLGFRVYARASTHDRTKSSTTLTSLSLRISQHKQIHTSLGFHRPRPTKPGLSDSKASQAPSLNPSTPTKPLTKH